jgi:hypothetical protein
MNAQPLPSTPEPEAGRCPAHPDRAVLGACTRCGTFYCEQDHRVVHGKAYCEPCSVRPEVDYLEGFRRRCWGRRDVWTWLVGLSGLRNGIEGLLLLTSGEAEAMPLGSFTLAAAAVCVCFWLGMPWARKALIGVPIGFLALVVLGEVESGALRALVALFLVLVIYNDTRNKLFFKLEVLPSALRKAWHLYMNNTMARAGLLLGVLGVLIPGVGFLALVCSIVGLRRVDPEATPPIGRKGQAIAGIILGSVATLGWISFMLRVLPDY